MWYSNLLNNYSFFKDEKKLNDDNFDDDYYDALHNYGDANVFLRINLIKNKV